MRLIRQAHEFEYRDAAGIDRLGQADIWEMCGGKRAVLVLRGLGTVGSGRPQLLSQARQARGYLAHTWLPFLVPHAELDVLVVYTGSAGQTQTLLLA